MATALANLFRRGDDGASLVEYALLIALIAVVCIGGITFFGGEGTNSVRNSGSRITACPPDCGP